MVASTRIQSSHVPIPRPEGQVYKENAHVFRTLTASLALILALLTYPSSYGAQTAGDQEALGEQPPGLRW